MKSEIEKDKQPELTELILRISQLRNNVYRSYFEEKLKNIFRLEKELLLIESMTPDMFKEYKDTHCPKIKRRAGLIQEIFYWQDHYQRQIASQLNYIEKLQLTAELERGITLTIR